MLGVFGRRIVEQIAGMRQSRSDPCPPVLLGISVKDEAKDPEVFNAIVDLIMALYREAIQVAASSGR